MATVNQIIDAWTKDLPVDKEWYQKRLEICKGCDFNSANDKTKAEGLAKKALTTIWGIAKVDACNACGCPLARKAALEESVCGMVDIGGIPKWGAITMELPNDPNIQIIQPEDQSYKMEVKNGNPIIWLDDTQEQVVSFTFHVKSKHKFESVQVSCGCTVPSQKDIDEETKEIKIKLSTKDFKTGSITTKSFTLKYTDEKHQPKNMKIQCKLRKI